MLLPPLALDVWGEVLEKGTWTYLLAVVFASHEMKNTESFVFNDLNLDFPQPTSSLWCVAKISINIRLRLTKKAKDIEVQLLFRGRKSVLISLNQLRHHFCTMDFLPAENKQSSLGRIAGTCLGFWEKPVVLL